MTTVDFVTGLADWLLADPSHIVAAASALAALTPTPDPKSPWGKLYRVLDIFALNVLRAKDKGPEPQPQATSAAQPQGQTPAGGGARALAALLALGLSLTAGACTPDGRLSAQAQKVVTVACSVDQMAQPVAVSLAPKLVPQVAPLAATDQALVHPAVVAACKAVGGIPTSVTATPVKPAAPAAGG